MWSVHNLKRLKLSAPNLVRIYKSLVRPVFDFACVVYHPMLTKTQSGKLERMQRKILKIIYGFDESYERCLGRSGLDHLAVRRSKLCEKFALKAARNPAFSRWFPLNSPSVYSLRHQKKYREFQTRTERLRCSPIYMYRHLLNSIQEDDC